MSAVYDWRAALMSAAVCVAGDEMVQLKNCIHTLCDVCYDKWGTLQGANATCPKCRKPMDLTPLPSGEDDDDEDDDEGGDVADGYNNEEHSEDGDYDVNDDENGDDDDDETGSLNGFIVSDDEDL